MRPYQFGVGGTWIDLDHVLAVQGVPHGASGRTDVWLTLSSRGKPLQFDLVPSDDYDRMLAAWKSTDVVRTLDLLSLLPGPYYMDPPDGGDVPVLEQLRRMAQDAARWREAQRQTDVWTHKSKGGEYRVLHHGAKIQTGTPLDDLEVVTVYRGPDGRVWCRPPSEFNERFQTLRGSLGVKP